MDEYVQLDNSLKTEYIFVKNCKNKDNAIVNVLENKITGDRVLVKYFNGTADVYKKLLKISHPNLPKVYKVVEADKKCIVVEEFIDGITIDETLQIEKISSSTVKKIILQLCSVLSVIHQEGIVHRDIKPENIIVDNSGNVKLIDFNISRINKDNQSKDTLMLGTTGFAAPEQYGISETDARSDIYSIGILVNVMLTGEHPSKKLCTGKWKRIVNKCTRINPKDRYNNVKELEADLKSNKFIVPIVMAVIIVLVAITVGLCSGRKKQQIENPETTNVTEPTQPIEITEENTTENRETTVVEMETTTEEVTTEEITASVEVPTTVEEPTTQEQTTEVETTVREEETTEEPTLNYTVTLEDDNCITVSGNGEITVKLGEYFTDPFFKSFIREGLQGAVFEEGITNIPENAFAACYSFWKITIPNTVVSIDGGAFMSTGVSEIVLPDSVEYLGAGALNNTQIITVELPSKLKAIGDFCFGSCQRLRYINVPPSVTCVGARAFQYSGLRAIVLPMGLTRLEEETFMGCGYLKGIVLPQKLESIGDYCFYGCSLLENIVIPPSVTCIGEFAFGSCDNLVIYVTGGSYAEQYCIDNDLSFEYIDSVTLRTVEVYYGLDHIEEGDFANDITLEEVIIPEICTYIGDGVFMGCINLKKIVIPPTMTYLGENCFYGCENLVLYITPGSYAEQYCIENNLKYEYVE